VAGTVDRVAIMYAGRVVEEGPLATVFAAPRHPYTRMLLESVPHLEPERERARLAALSVAGDTPSPVDRPTGCAFRTRCPAARQECAAIRPEPEPVDNLQRVACLRWRELGN
jgi:oligopeptide/dipeptide ABC transporter ATP-binding protein